jgi:hypothetical protein
MCIKDGKEDAAEIFWVLAGNASMEFWSEVQFI